MNLLDLLNDLSVDDDARPFQEQCSFAFRIAEQCNDPEDVAESALFLIASEVESEAKRKRSYLAAVWKYLSESERTYAAGDAAELEALVRRIRAALEPAQPMEKAA